jgi:hypothetical protein
MENKNEFQVSIKKLGILTNDIFRLIAFNNEDKDSYSLQEIYSYLKIKKSEYPAHLRNMKLVHLENEIVIMEDGESTTLIIQKTK